MGDFKEGHGKTRFGKILQSITNHLPQLAGDVFKVATSANPLGAALKTLKDKLKGSDTGQIGTDFLEDINSIPDSELKLFELETKDAQDARNNETIRDTSEESSVLSKNIHEIIAILFVVGWFFVLGWTISLFIQKVITVNQLVLILAATGLKDMVLLILGYLYGRTKPQK